MVDVSTESVRESVSLGLGGKEPVEFGLCSETGVGAEGAFSCTGQVASPWTCATSQGETLQEEKTSIPSQTQASKAL